MCLIRIEISGLCSTAATRALLPEHKFANASSLQDEVPDALGFLFNQSFCAASAHVGVARRAVTMLQRCLVMVPDSKFSEGRTPSLSRGVLGEVVVLRRLSAVSNAWLVNVHD